MSDERLLSGGMEGVVRYMEELKAERDQAREMAVALEQQLALAVVLEVPRPGNLLPLQLRRSYGHADRWSICDRTGRRWDREGRWLVQGDGIAEDARCDSSRFTLDEALPLAVRLARGDDAED